MIKPTKGVKNKQTINDHPNPISLDSPINLAIKYDMHTSIKRINKKRVIIGQNDYNSNIIIISNRMPFIKTLIYSFRVKKIITTELYFNPSKFLAEAFTTAISNSPKLLKNAMCAPPLKSL
jgi:hypothetical protein